MGVEVAVSTGSEVTVDVDVDIAVSAGIDVAVAEAVGVVVDGVLAAATVKDTSSVPIKLPPRFASE